MTSRRHDQAFEGHVHHKRPPHGRRLRMWLRSPLSVLDRLSPHDASGLQSWLLHAVDEGVVEFGIQCPTVTLVTALEEHLAVDQNLSPAFCMLQEAIRQKGALTRIASRVAENDLLYETLMAPIMDADASGTAVIDTALLILMGEHYGKAEDAYWRVIETWHIEQFGHAPPVTKPQFDIHMSA